jgi:hypothetical protein
MQLPLNKISRKSSGNTILIAIIFLFVMLIWVLSYSRTAFQTSNVAFRNELKEMGKQLLEGGMGEAFSILDRECQDINHTHTRWLIDRNDPSSLSWELNDLPLMREAIEDIEEEWVVKVSALKVTASRRDKDFRACRDTSDPDSRYYGKEGHGTVVFHGTLEFSRGGKPCLELTLQTHHDYKVACLVSCRTDTLNRVRAKNLNLDYALYVRDGLLEFRKSTGRMLNRKNFDLQIRPRGYGRIYFGLNGVAANPDDFVFLNVPEDQIPSSLTESRAVTYGEQGLIAQRFLTKVPTIQQNLAAEMAAGRLGYYGATTPRAFLQDMMRDLSPRLRSQFYPITVEPSDPDLKYVQDGLFKDPDFSGDAFDNTEPGASLLDPGDDPRTLIEGTVRKRFLDVIRSSGFEIFVRTGLKIPFDAQSGFLAALPDKAYNRRCAKLGQNRHPFIQAIDEVLETRLPDPILTCVSRVDDELPYGLINDSYRKTTPLECSLPEEYCPFEFGNLRSFSIPEGAGLYKIGMLENNVLKPQGAIYIRSSFTLGEEGPLECRGHGLISSSGNITIKRGIKCAPGSILLLSAQGSLIVDTSEPIEAGVRARDIKVLSGQRLNLKGSLWVEELGSADWPEDTHVIEYDPQRYLRSQDLYSVNLSPRTTFSRLEIDS